MQEPANPADPSPKNRSRASTKLILFLVGAMAIAAASFVLAPHWIGYFGGDDAVVRFERSQRRLRYDLGMAMPGEPDLARLSERLAESGVALGAPILVRIYKRDFELEIWMQRGGKFQRFATYPICRWSGWLGPKLKQGDAQAPEGFYTVDAAALNPNSKYLRSFNLGYPNAFDRANGRTGCLIMVHGGCASIGCFAMTNAQMQEIWRLVTAALSGGQKRFQVQVYPFRMSERNMADHASDPDIGFWRSIKVGNDAFETSLLPPKVMACKGSYRFEPGEPGAVGDALIEDRCPAAAAKS